MRYELHSRRGELLRLIDDEEARDLLAAGKVVSRKGSRAGCYFFQLADAGPPMRGFPCGLSRTVSRVCVENWPRGYWEFNQRATQWTEAL